LIFGDFLQPPPGSPCFRLSVAGMGD